MVPVASWVRVWSIFRPMRSPLTSFPSTRWAERIFSVTVCPMLLTPSTAEPAGFRVQKGDLPPMRKIPSGNQAGRLVHTATHARDVPCQTRIRPPRTLDSPSYRAGLLAPPLPPLLLPGPRSSGCRGRFVRVTVAGPLRSFTGLPEHPNELDCRRLSALRAILVRPRCFVKCVLSFSYNSDRWVALNANSVTSHRLHLLLPQKYCQCCIPFFVSFK